MSNCSLYLGLCSFDCHFEKGLFSLLDLYLFEGQPRSLLRTIGHKVELEL